MTDFKKLRKKNISLAKKTIRESISEDNYIIQTINNIEELAKVTNVLTKRLRDWYNLYLPEFSRSVSDNEAFVKLILSKKKKELIKELKITETMGKDLASKDLKPMLELALRIQSLFNLRDELKKYLEEIMNSYCKNLFTISGTLIGAKLIEAAGSLKKLAMMPSSTIQLLGAEKALFRHLKTGARPPKHGLILHHPLVASANKDKKGKYSRVLADKLNIAIKADYFKGEFIGDKLMKELKEKLK
ncbi:hypothetical protein ACFLTH_14430 [Bacteroidota bacterium]